MKQSKRLKLLLQLTLEQEELDLDLAWCLLLDDEQSSR